MFWRTKNRLLLTEFEAGVVKSVSYRPH